MNAPSPSGAAHAPHPARWVRAADGAAHRDLLGDVGILH
jgi:hypothetical protein